MEAMLNDPLSVLILSHADDKLMLGHMQSDWTGLGPILEEDIASSAMAQDDLSHALTLYEFLGNQHDLDPDVIAFERAPEDYACCDLVTQSDEFDWASSVVKRWLMATFMKLAIERLSAIENVNDLSARCGRILPEQQLQVDHLQGWISRLCSGGSEARERIQTALDRLAPSVGMVMEIPGHRLPEDEEFCCGRDELFGQWTSQLQTKLDETGLNASFSLPNRGVRGGRRGQHADHFHEQLAEMTEVRRIEPGASW
ncbi:MAG: phenylacetate-CoA oxygenase subunit PaaI [Phycisphaerae bacterium]|nr:phenylacetate-CoA oxygenase subunit PaaI [Phycisphaerae bacterium]|tara:strand:+ start:2654 stop:3421 length:768 start_codon:yes stop_codon:yes gene_type:complete